MNFKTINAELKAGEADGLEAGEFVAVMSDDSVDRDGEVILPGAFNPLPKKINVDIDHRMTIESIVASGVPFYDGDTLMIRGRWADTDLARDVRGLVNDGHVDSLSVAFRAAKRGETGEGEPPTIKKAELLNVGIVAIPSNRNALVVASKAAGFDLDDREEVEVGLITPDEVRAANLITSAAAVGMPLDDIANAEIVDLTETAGEDPEPEPTPEPDPAPEEPAAEPTFTLDEARSHIDAERRQQLARLLMDPELAKSRLGHGSDPEGAAFLAMVAEAKNVAVVHVPDGLDPVAAGKAAQDAVDALQISTQAPAAPPDESPAPAADDLALAQAHARVIQQRTKAALALAEL